MRLKSSLSLFFIFTLSFQNAIAGHSEGIDVGYYSDLYRSCSANLTRKKNEGCRTSCNNQCVTDNKPKENTLLESHYLWSTKAQCLKGIKNVPLYRNKVLSKYNKLLKRNKKDKATKYLEKIHQQWCRDPEI